ncbi:unnamed protein product [Musa textilis]
MHLIEYLAQAGYFEFFVRGKDPTQVTTIASEALDGQFGTLGPPETLPETALSPSSEESWNEPPLILGAQMGLHEFVGKILQVCPQLATYRDTKGRNVLQVAVMYRREEIVKIIMGMRTILPSWLFSDVDPEGNTILHLASDGSPDVAKEEQEEPDAMQLHSI